MAGTDAVGAGCGCTEKIIRSELEDAGARKNDAGMQKIMPEMESDVFKEDTTFNDIQDKSLQQWLDEMEQHEDVAVRGGVKLTREYVQYLKDEIGRLRHENEVKNAYLKKSCGRRSRRYKTCQRIQVSFSLMNIKSWINFVRKCTVKQRRRYMLSE